MALAQTWDPNEGRYCYRDYATWNDGKRYELHDGVPVLMSPAPSIPHQLVVTALSLLLGNYLKGKPCILLLAPVDVRLNHDKGDDTVVQPDLLVVCDRAKLDGKSCLGAPDFIIEVTSPSTARYDRVTKLNKYREAGVPEYWIVDPEARYVEAFTLQEGKYYVRTYGDTEEAPVPILANFKISLPEVFENLPPLEKEEPSSEKAGEKEG